VRYVFSIRDTRHYRFPTHTNDLIIDRAESAASEVLLVDTALEKLAKEYPEHAGLIEKKYFGGWDHTDLYGSAQKESAALLRDLVFAHGNNTVPSESLALIHEMIYGAKYFIEIQNADGSWQLLMEGEKSRLVVMKGRTVTHIPLEEAANKQRLVPLDHMLIQAARNVGSSFGD